VSGPWEQYQAKSEGPWEQFKPAAEPSIADRAGRVAGLGARSIVKGVSAIPTLMADAVSEGVNLGAKAVGADYRMQRPSAVLDRTLTQAGFPQPETPVERVSSDVTGALTGMGGQLAVLRGMAGPVAQQLTQMPGKQLIAAATGPGAASVTREAGGGPGAQLAAGVAGSMAPFGPNLMRGNKPLTPTEQVALDSQAAGYRIPPTQANPSMVNRVLEGAAGKITTGQQASAGNQRMTNKLAAEALGLDPKTTITPAVLERVRGEAGTAYNNIKILPLKFKPDQEYQQAIAGLGNDFAAAAKEFPEIAGNKLIEELQKGLNKPTISPVAAVELVKKLRFDAAKNYKAFDDPAKAALAGAQKQAANAIEELIERRLTQSGKPELVDAFRAARERIAKSYDIESALNDTTGTVSARVIGNQMNKGKPMTGPLATIGRFANAFPKAAQAPEPMGSLPGWSPLDLYAGAGLGLGGYAAGSPSLMALGLLRPTARTGILSGAYQNTLGAPTLPMAREQAGMLGAMALPYQPR
jgi:hypothetical protein